ncbi:VPLPA-CTERM sorting domain-containing protein [Dinoroseobacter sp. S76]|uniref:VPLPA-CTERM sorting domain-containing protein n=1 Tax=Dinoroseobacter sp. S76 TaxID=3415124 RepID=UPI003C7B517E
MSFKSLAAVLAIGLGVATSASAATDKFVYETAPGNGAYTFDLEFTVTTADSSPAIGFLVEDFFSVGAFALSSIDSGAISYTVNGVDTAFDNVLAAGQFPFPVGLYDSNDAVFVLGFGSQSLAVGDVVGFSATGLVPSLAAPAPTGGDLTAFLLNNTGDAISERIIIEEHVPAPVPLPASGLLLIAGLGGAAAVARRRKAA